MVQSQSHTSSLSGPGHTWYNLNHIQSVIHQIVVIVLPTHLFQYCHSLRTRMTEDRLAHLPVLSIEKEVAQELKVECIIDEFAATDKNRCIVLF